MLYSSKAPNRYLIGATSEFDNYSVGNTEQGVSWLEHYATERIPELANAHIIKQWSGVRPYTDGELPIMDRVDDGFICHYRPLSERYFIVPVIGRDIANWLLTGVKPTRYESFNVSRRLNHEMHY